MSVASLYKRSDPTYNSRIANTTFTEAGGLSSQLGGPSSGIYANTSSVASGSSGNISVTTNELRLSDTARLSVSSQGTGAAGNLVLSAERVQQLSQSTVEAQPKGGSEGNIEIAAPLLVLRDRSQITTNADGRATGGNISLNTPLLVGLGNSDIVARATQGSGGRINVNTSGLFGISPGAELTPNSDINASSDLGIDGTVAVSTPDINIDRGLVELPSAPIDEHETVLLASSATHSWQQKDCLAH